MSSVFDSFCVKSSVGVDVDATVENFRSQLVSHLSVMEGLGSRISSSIHSLFDQVPDGQRLPSAWLVSEVMKGLGANPSNYTLLTGAIATYLKANQQEPNPLFKTQKGPGGGICRIRQPVSAAASNPTPEVETESDDSTVTDDSTSTDEETV